MRPRQIHLLACGRTCGPPPFRCFASGIRNHTVRHEHETEVDTRKMLLGLQIGCRIGLGFLGMWKDASIEILKVNYVVVPERQIYHLQAALSLTCKLKMRIIACLRELLAIARYMSDGSMMNMLNELPRPRWRFLPNLFDPAIPLAFSFYKLSLLDRA
jgi:hypothetical protein